MTARWLELLQQYRYLDTVTVSLAALGFGLMACWYIVRTGRPLFLARHRESIDLGFWGLILVLDLGLVTFLGFFWPKG